MNNVFVVGCHRSGTTFLTSELTRLSNEEIYSLPYETAFFVDTYKSKPIDNIGTLKRQIRKMLNRQFVVSHYPSLQEELINSMISKEFPVGYKEIFDELCQSFLRIDGLRPKIIVEKTPTHLFQVQRVKELYPEARFIFLERNPLSVIASALEKGINRLKMFPFSRKIHLMAEYWEWKRNYDIYRRLMPEMHENLLLVNFEKMITEPSKTVKEISGFLGVELSEEIEIDNTTLDKYKKKLSSRDIELLTGLYSREIADRYGVKEWSKIGKRDKALYFLVRVMCKVEIWTSTNFPYSIKILFKKYRGDFDVSHI